MRGLTRFSRFTTSLLRTYIRFAPLTAGKRWLWSRVMDPYFIWDSHPFVAKTTFDMQIKGNAKDIIQQYIYYFGVWEPHITSWINSSLRPGDSFIDVGANIGYYSLLASRLVGAHGSVVAIEASPKTFVELHANLVLNEIHNVRAVNLAASECRGKLKLFRGHEHNTGLTTVLDHQGFELECEVTAAPLSEIVQPKEMKHARIVKIDVEGAELSVVAGMGPIITAGRPDLEFVIEVNPAALARQGTNPDGLLKPFFDAGFHPYEVDNDYSALSYIPIPTAKRPRRIRSPIERTTDVVLSHHNKEFL
jgi:FkbM family methyltransferase